MPSEFVHLHVHTEYSLLDGQSRISTLMERAQELEMPAVGISDHGVMFGVIDFYRAAKKANIKPVLGMEAYLAPRKRTDKEAAFDKRPFHMLLFAKNEIGYKNLMKLASKAQLEGYYYRPRIDWEIMDEFSEGLIATSGCLAAEIPRLVEEGRDDEARARIGKYLEVFGEDNFYLEVQPHKIDQLNIFNEWLFDYRKSNHTNVQLYASNDVHYVYKNDADVHDTLLCIQTGAHKSEEKRMRMSPQDSYYMKSADEMRAEFLKHGMPEDMINEAFANSLKIADMTDVNLDSEDYHLPIFPVPPEFKDDAGVYLRYLCEMGLSWRYPGRDKDPVLQERLDYELGVVGGMGFNTYFLIVWDLCEFARDEDIWWNVRGSGAGSLVAYSLGITNIDPIQNSLLFERFLNPGRVSMPDIDLDYPDDRRAEMIAYTVEKYGKDKVAAIITFGTMGAKAAVKDVGRALNVDLAKITRATSLIPQEARQKKIKEYIALEPDLRKLYDEDSDIKQVMDAASQLQGTTRHASTHAAGIIISDKPLEEYTPLHRITGTDPSGGSLEAVTQFPMETAESIGLLKVDFLGLSTLTILRRACDLINRHHGTDYTMDNIPYRHDDNERQLTEDESRMLDETFEMMGRGETIGVFQVESGGMQSMLRGMRPQKFEHVVAGISLYRPGPMDFIPAYNRRLHGEEEIPYKHPKLVPILEETYAIITYQEQIMQIAGELFGYELGEADLMRKAVSKKKAADLAKHKDIFLTRGPENGVSESVAEAIFDEIEFFANYGFNKCLSGNTEIVDAATGRIVTIGELYEKQATVAETLTCDTGNLRLQSGKITDVMFNGIKPVFRLTTQTGRQIEATGNHPFYTFEGWRNLEDLTEDARIAIPRCIPVEGKKEWDDEQIKEFVNQFEKIDDTTVYELTNESLKQLLGHFVNERGFKIQGLGLVLAMNPKTRDKARQLQHLLLRIGVNSRQSLTHLRADDPLESRWVYQLHIKDSEEIQRLLHVIGSYLLFERREKIEQLVRIPVAVGDRDTVQEPDSDIYWDGIVSIEYIGEEPTYDLTIEGTHNFIANDILVHNSHASDYAVITVQTAFLKCHYKAEYMTALLSVQFDNLDKVALFLEECRRLEIPVLPPHVNHSAVDFDIEVTEDDKRGIRFGMGAIKNAGVGALQHIIDERNGEGQFSSLVEFCHRVNLSKVGKRTVESLIKVGAFGDWGKRDALYLALEQIVGFSTAHHKAKDDGQMSMFGEATGIEESLNIPVPPKKKEVSRRDQLAWEKDLMGLYVSGRPVDPHISTFKAMSNLNIVADLKDPEINTKQDEQVRIAGEVIALRKVTTKKGQQMAIMMLEDWHESAGSIEVVLFPRIWEQTKNYVAHHKQERAEENKKDKENKEEKSEDTLFELEEGDILVVIGKYDNSRNDIQVICDSISFEFETMTPDEIEAVLSASTDEEPAWMNGHGSQEEPPPFVGYDEETGETLQNTAPPPMPAKINGSASMPNIGTEQEEQPAWANSNGHHIQDDTLFLDFNQGKNEGHNPVHISVHFNRSNDPNRDRRHLRRIHRTLVEYPGKDSFSIVIEASKKSNIMDFPNHTTGVCDALLRELENIVGEDNILIEDKK